MTTAHTADQAPAPRCPCGEDEPHVMARRKTAQGSTVKLWSDGSLTWALGRYVKGSPHARTPGQLATAHAAGWLVMGEVELYDDDEVESLVRAARWAAERGLDHGAMRARMHRAPVLRPVWEVIEADRDGKPRVRCWKLPRLRWPGLAVWCDGATYSIWTEAGRTGTYAPTGIEFSNLADLSAHLSEYDAMYSDRGTISSIE
jgi:hypothetical protein